MLLFIYFCNDWFHAACIFLMVFSFCHKDNLFHLRYHTLLLKKSINASGPLPLPIICKKWTLYYWHVPAITQYSKPPIKLTNLLCLNLSATISYRNLSPISHLAFPSLTPRFQCWLGNRECPIMPRPHRLLVLLPARPLATAPHL